MNKLTSYLVAGARLTGCKSSPTIGDAPHSRDLVLPTGARLLWHDERMDDDAVVQDPRTLARHRTPGVSILQVLEAWQPDRESSVSSQNFIDTGHYLPVGRAERAALGVDEMPAADVPSPSVCRSCGQTVYLAIKVRPALSPRDRLTAYLDGPAGEVPAVDVALARDLLDLDGVLGEMEAELDAGTMPWDRLDHWPAARDFITRTLAALPVEDS